MHQAEIDSIEVTEGEIAQNIDMQINRWIQQAGSREKLEEYKKMTVSQMRSQLHDDFKNNQLIQAMKEKLVRDISVTPSDVRNYFRNMPEDSIPFVPSELLSSTIKAPSTNCVPISVKFFAGISEMTFPEVDNTVNFPLLRSSTFSYFLSTASILPSLAGFMERYCGSTIIFPELLIHP